MKRFAIVSIAVMICICAVAATNYVSLQRHVSSILQSDPRNDGIEVLAHYRMFVISDSLVFDLRGVSGQQSPTDVFRVLLQFADAVDDRSFNEVILSYSGTPKFLLEGEYFQKLGNEYGVQNPVFTMRTFPENVYNIDGSRAFSEWTGGLLGVMTKQMEDFSNFHDQWYVSDMVQN